MTHLECACTKKEKPSSIGRTVWMHWRRSATWQNPFRILSTTGSKILEQRSTGQKLQCWRISSMPAGQEKGQTQAQVGRSVHNWPSPAWRSIPPARCIGQPTRAESMERSPSPRILCLAPDSVFVSFLRPFFIYTVCLTFLPFTPSFLL